MEENKILEREYIVPLRKSWIKVPDYRRVKRAIKELKGFIAKHMKVTDRDITKVKLDKYLNEEMWFRGTRKPPAKIKVKARKEGEIVKVELVDVPQAVKFRMERDRRKKDLTEKKIAEKKVEEKKEEKDVEEKKEIEKEKEKSGEIIQDLKDKENRKEKKHSAVFPKLKNQVRTASQNSDKNN